jgi:hypothetical protein
MTETPKPPEAHPNPVEVRASFDRVLYPWEVSPDAHAPSAAHSAEVVDEPEVDEPEEAPEAPAAPTSRGRRSATS